MNLGEKVRYIRKSNELNQKEFANRIRVSQGTLSDIERGVCLPSCETIMAFKRSGIFFHTREEFVRYCRNMYKNNLRSEDPMMKNMGKVKFSLSVLTFIFTLLFSTSTVFADADTGKLQLQIKVLRYLNSDLLVVGTLNNVGTETINGISSFTVQIYDKQKEVIATGTFQSDNLANLILKPGDSMVEKFQFPNAIVGDISSFSWKMNIIYKNPSSDPISDLMTIKVNNQALQPDVMPFIEDGTTLVPLRAVSEAMGATVGWDSTTQTITLTKAKTNISMVIGSTSVQVNDKNIELSVAPKIVNGSTMVPLRIIAQAFGSTIAWGNTNGKTVISIRSFD